MNLENLFNPIPHKAGAKAHASGHQVMTTGFDALVASQHSSRAGSALYKFLLILFVAACSFSSAAFAQTYRYGPEVSLHGTVISAPGKTPDGDDLVFPALELSVPIAVDATPGDEDFEPAETRITLIHLALNEGTATQFKALKGHKVNVRGTLFHSDNGHHQTDVLMSVKEISAAR